MIEEEMDLGVSAKPSRQCVEAAKEAISTVCTLIRKTTNRVKDTI